MKKFIKENWFKLSALMLVFLFGVLFLFYLSKKESLSEIQIISKIEQDGMDLYNNNNKEPLNFDKANESIPVETIKPDNKKYVDQEKNINKFTNEVLLIHTNLYYGSKFLSESADFFAEGDYIKASQYNLKANDYFILETEKSRDLLKYNTPKGYEKISSDAFCAASGLMLASANYTAATLALTEKDFNLAESKNIEASNYLDSSSKCMHSLARWLAEQGR